MMALHQKRKARWVPLCWGVIYFIVGMASSFTLNDRDVASSLVLVVAGFLLVLPLTIIGTWFPRPAAIALVACGLLTELTAILKSDSKGMVSFFFIFIVPDVLVAVYLWGFRSERLTDI